MSWHIDITADRAIAWLDAEAIVEALPDGLRYSEIGQVLRNFEKRKQTWGWAAACDIDNPKGATWRVGGSYGMSGHLAVETAEALRAGLVALGYVVVKVNKHGWENP